MLPKTGNVFPGAGGGVRLEMSASIDVAARRPPARGWQPAIDRRNAHRHALLYYRDFRSAWSNSTTPWASIWVAGGAIWKISPHKTDPQLMIKLRRSDKCAEGRPWVMCRPSRPLCATSAMRWFPSLHTLRAELTLCANNGHCARFATISI